MKITIDENCVFTFNLGHPTIGVWRHTEPDLHGSVSYVCEIDFTNFNTMSLFQEMVEMSLEHQENKQNDTTM
jgi:hypothetical protein